MQKRTSPIKFAILAEKSEKGSISNLSSKVRAALRLAEQRASAESRAYVGSWTERGDVAEAGFEASDRGDIDLDWRKKLDELQR